jgi:CO/xanthine dehydrogenase FAD-binding subunit
MRTFVPDYTLITPPTLDEALNLLAREPGVWRPFAGGTDLMVLFEAGKLAHTKFFNLWHLDELRGIEITPEAVTLGALTTYTDVRANATLQAEFPMLCQAAAVTGGLAIQNRGTLGGNIANASPAADSPPALLVYGAALELVSARGSRWVEYAAFHRGYKQMDLRADELIRRIRLPRRGAKGVHYYRKVGTRQAQAISKVCFAAWADIEGSQVRDARVALASVAPVPRRCHETEKALRGNSLGAEMARQARAALQSEITPISDIRSTENYRLQVALNLLDEFLARCEITG